MRKSCVLIKNGVDVNKYFKIIAYLKRKGVGYRPKKLKTLTHEEVEKFIIEAL